MNWWDQAGFLPWEQALAKTSEWTTALGAMSVYDRDNHNAWSLTPKDLSATPEQIQARMTDLMRKNYDLSAAKHYGASFDEYVNQGWGASDFVNQGSVSELFDVDYTGSAGRDNYRQYHSNVHAEQQAQAQREREQAEQKRRQEEAAAKAEAERQQAEAARKEAEAKAQAQREATQRQVNLGKASQTVANQGSLDRPLVLSGGSRNIDSTRLGIGRGGGKRGGGSRLSRVLGFT